MTTLREAVEKKLEYEPNGHEHWVNDGNEIVMSRQTIIGMVIGAQYERRRTRAIDELVGEMISVIEDLDTGAKVYEDRLINILTKLRKAVEEK